MFHASFTGPRARNAAEPTGWDKRLTPELFQVGLENERPSSLENSGQEGKPRPVWCVLNSEDNDWWWWANRGRSGTARCFQDGAGSVSSKSRSWAQSWLSGPRLVAPRARIVASSRKAVPPIRRTGFPGRLLLEHRKTHRSLEVRKEWELSETFSYAHPIRMASPTSACYIHYTPRLSQWQSSPSQFCVMSRERERETRRPRSPSWAPAFDSSHHETTPRLSKLHPRR